MSIARILIAEEQKALSYVTNSLAGYTLLIASSLKEAEKITHADGIDLFVLGIHFDDSRAADFASTIRKTVGHENTPIILVRILPSSIEKFIRTTTTALKISGMITEFMEFQTTDEVSSKLRKSIEAFLPVDKILP